jgi:hypothetical protein
MARMRHALLASAASGWFCGAFAQPAAPENSLVVEFAADKCARLAVLPATSCAALIEAAASKALGTAVDKDALRDTLEKDLTDPEFLNSALRQIFGARVPIGLEFKALDSDQLGESVLALAFDVDKSFFRSEVDDSGDWNRQTSLSFEATGTLVNDSAANPRDFIQTRFNGWKTLTTNIPTQDDDFANRLSDLSVDAATACAGPGAATSQACSDAKAAPFAMLDQATSFLDSFRHYKLAASLGYEADQELDAEQSTFGIAAFGQFEKWGSSSGARRVTPAIRLGLDKVDPDDETPRALAGDDSSYYRVSGELSLWVPVGNFQGQRFVLTASYRTYRELSPSDIVKNANLDTHSLRTLSLTTPTGLFISYSSGKLPFDQQSDDVVALGWQTYF